MRHASTAYHYNPVAALQVTCLHVLGYRLPGTNQPDGSNVHVQATNTMFVCIWACCMAEWHASLHAHLLLVIREGLPCRTNLADQLGLLQVWVHCLRQVHKSRCLCWLLVGTTYTWCHDLHAECRMMLEAISRGHKCGQTLMAGDAHMMHGLHGTCRWHP